MYMSSASRNDYIVFSRDVTAAILLFLNNGTVAMYPRNPAGIDFYHHTNVFFCFGGKTRLLIM